MSPRFARQPPSNPTITTSVMATETDRTLRAEPWTASELMGHIMLPRCEEEV